MSISDQIRREIAEDVAAVQAAAHADMMQKERDQLRAAVYADAVQEERERHGPFRLQQLRSPWSGQGDTLTFAMAFGNGYEVTVKWIDGHQIAQVGVWADEDHEPVVMHEPCSPKRVAEIMANVAKGVIE